ncbi:LirA/MavJ family T4SS effector [Archangium primigenium]|uniref:LirA/MavJ family T4SS effector n=1 Tax=[Archangium] primigenium TaxID=2792470 RepID=UPI00195A0CBD|nr:LirA/MavJ family T4SS effector [Archangium primigenium]MBM7112617.1 hypothetical protein [Archangium primigenium]
MTMPTEEAIKDEYTTAYANYTRARQKQDSQAKAVAFNPTFWFSKAFVKISQFLYADASSPFWDALLHLEQAMQQELRQRTGQTLDPSALEKVSFAHGRANAFSTEADPTRHLLTTILTRYEQQEGFREVDTDGDGHPRTSRFLGQLSSGDFAYHIQQAHLAKDYVGLEHGEYTHRIQWYCLGQAKAHLGLTDTREDRDKMATLFSKSGLFWGLTFDRNTTPTMYDFRKPEYLNNWLVASPTSPGGAKKFPLLHNFLKSRRERLGEKGYGPWIIKMMIAKNVFPEKFEALNTENLTKYKSFRTNPTDAQLLFNTCLDSQSKLEVERLYKNKVLKGDWTMASKPPQRS